MTRLLALSAVTSLVLATGFAATPARAGSAGNFLGVSANVLGACTIDAATLAFGDYDPAAARDGSGTITVRCTQGSNFSVDLGTGSNASGAARRMAGGVGEYLGYELYSDSGRTTVWSTAGYSANATTVAAAFSPYTLTVWGRIPAGQTVSTGAYADSVTMTVNF